MAIPVFKPSNKTKNIELQVGDKVYAFNVSPTNQGYIKQCISLEKEARELLGGEIENASTLEEVDALYARFTAKQHAIIDIVAPGKWEELWTASDRDVLTMMELISFIVTEIRSGAGKAMMDQVKPVEHVGEEV